MSGDPATLAHYEASVPYYTHAFDSTHSRHLDAFLDRITSGARILELGCGTGRDAARMIERGFEVDPTDGTKAMIAKARERYCINARLMRFDELTAEQEYDAVWAHACLFHIPQAELSQIVKSIHRSMRNEGLHYASFKQGDNEFRDDRGRLNSHVTSTFIKQTYSVAGFEILELEPWQGKGADGVLRDWIALTVRKP